VDRNRNFAEAADLALQLSAFPKAFELSDNPDGVIGRASMLRPGGLYGSILFMPWPDVARSRELVRWIEETSAAMDRLFAG